MQRLNRIKITPEYFRGKNVTVIGIARSGVACANLLYGLGARVSVSDMNDNEATRRNASRLLSPKIKVELGPHRKEIISHRDLVVVSPGIPQTALPVVWAKQLQIPVIGEIECGWMVCQAKVIAVTGSNGKTTVTTLIGKVLEAAGKKVFVCGNIGTPFCAYAAKMKADEYACLEVSSFQLQNTVTFKPKIAVILNFSRNHLDRHSDMQEYLEAKKKIFRNQDAHDHLVLNVSDPIVKGLSQSSRAKVTYFRQGRGLDPNQAAVMAVASLLGIKKELVLKVFKEFKGVEHRLEFVASIKGVRFINDSKATTVNAAAWALKRVPGKIILIAGGRDKGNEYKPILNTLGKKVAHAVLIGEARQKMKEAFGPRIEVEESSTLEEAVAIAFGIAKAKESVLLSPMCASFDMFSDYEDRGRAFKKAVQGLMNVKKKKRCVR